LATQQDQSIPLRDFIEEYSEQGSGNRFQGSGVGERLVLDEGELRRTLLGPI